jgi:hypothetical protein
MMLALASVVFLGSESLWTRDHILLSDLGLPFSSPPTTHRITVEVFDPTRTLVECVLLCMAAYIVPGSHGERLLLVR